MINNSELDAFWRYLNGIKYFTAVATVQNFSTRGPALDSITRLFSLIGKELGLLVASKNQYHFFTNPSMKQLDYLNCQKGTTYGSISQPVEFAYKFSSTDPLKWTLLTFRNKNNEDTPCLEVLYNPDDRLFPPLVRKALGSPKHIALAPFCKDDTPFGFYVFSWNQNLLPALFEQTEEGQRLREGAIRILYYVHSLVGRLISNHYFIHRDTYIPSFQRVGSKAVCILFADIRNFTSAFETSRLMTETGEKYPQLLIGLIKAYLEAASIIIPQPGIGRIDKFIGDGIMATFGEYDVSRGSNDVFACLLALYSAAILHDAFEKLRLRFFRHDVFRNFEREYNDVLNIKLGIGLNFGKVIFDYFGSNSIQIPTASNLMGGYLEYTAVGDHVNIAQRLEGLASKPITQVSLLERGTGRERRSKNFIAPIMLSRTVFMRVSQALVYPVGPDSVDFEEMYRSSFSLKGKGSAVEAYEVFPDEINGDHIIRIVEKFAVKRISDTVKSAWIGEGRVAKERGFKFSDDLADQLAERYFPPTA